MKLKTLTSTLVLNFLLFGSQVMAMDQIMYQAMDLETDTPVSTPTIQPEKLDVVEEKDTAASDATVKLSVDDLLFQSRFDPDLVHAMVIGYDPNATIEVKTKALKAAEQLIQNAALRKQAKVQVDSPPPLPQEHGILARFFGWGSKDTPVQTTAIPLDNSDKKTIETTTLPPVLLVETTEEAKGPVVPVPLTSQEGTSSFFTNITGRFWEWYSPSAEQVVATFVPLDPTLDSGVVPVVPVESSSNNPIELKDISTETPPQKD